MSKTVSSLVLLIGMTIGGSVSGKDCKQFFDEEYFSARQQLRNEGKLKRIQQQHFEKELENEFKQDILSALSVEHQSVENPEDKASDNFENYDDYLEDDPDSGFTLESVFDELDDKTIT